MIEFRDPVECQECGGSGNVLSYTSMDCDVQTCPMCKGYGEVERAVVSGRRLVGMKLIHGDCLEKMEDIPDSSVDMCLTDPPYGTTACKWDSVIHFEPMWRELKRIVKPNGAICLFGSEPFSSALRMSNIKMFKYDWVWNKKNAGAFAVAKYRPLGVIETISVFGKGRIEYHPIMTIAAKKNKRSRGKQYKKKRRSPIEGNLEYCIVSEKHDENKRFPKNILEFSSRSGDLNARKRMHSSQKPVPLLEYLIKTYTIENETVLDFTMGSGSTGVACVNTGRNFIGIERDDKYFQIAQDRIRKAQEEKAQELFK